MWEILNDLDDYESPFVQEYLDFLEEKEKKKKYISKNDSILLIEFKTEK